MSADTALIVALARLEYDRAKLALRALYCAPAGTVAVAEVSPGVKRLEVRGLQNPKAPKSVVQKWEDRRAEFEQQLQLAAAERALGVEA